MAVSLLVQQALFVFIKIVFPLVKIVETIGWLGGFRCLCRRFLKLAFLVLCIQKADIVQIFHAFGFPSCQNPVCVLEAWLSCLQNRAAAGFLDDFHAEAVILHPGVHEDYLIIHRASAGDAHGF